MRILIDENMPVAEALFAELGELVRVPGRHMTAEQVAEADVLLVRSVTRVDAALLAQAHRLTFVGTATIGTDHIDQVLLAERGIAFSSAPGCNKISVGEYVISALLVLAERYQLSLAGMTLGVVGAGNTGSAVAAKAQALGMQVCLCDPPLQAAGDSREFVSYDTALGCDVVSFHVPLIDGGESPTRHLLDAERIAALPGGQFLINASRGEVWDNLSLLLRQQGGEPLRLVMDVWEHEPEILQELIPYTELATQHIAGYSLEGKVRGTYQLYQAYCQFAGLPVHHTWQALLPSPAIASVQLQGPLTAANLQQLVHLVYDVRRDDARFRMEYQDAASFDRLRKQYPERREWSSLTLHGCTDPRLAALGFSVAN
jgi:erythronate-4-phosphate dehydrogenase